MSDSTWNRVSPGDSVTVRNRFIRLSRTVTVAATLPGTASGFVDTDGQTITPDGHEIAVGTITVEQSAQSLIRLLATAQTPQHREEMSC